MHKRDFIFIDESGDPGELTPYYILGLLHITDETLKKINVDLGAFRYFGHIRNELKSTRLNQLQKDKLLSILKIAIAENIFLKTTAVFTKKDEYQGKYLKETEKVNKNPTYFRHLMIRRLLENHFRKNEIQSKETELIIDRFHSSEDKEYQLRNYLGKLSFLSLLPNFLHITQADSRYVELLQVADWVAGSVKEKYFTHPERDFNDLFNYLNVYKVIE